MEKYLSLMSDIFQEKLVQKFNIFAVLLKKCFLALLWFLHNLQFWLSILIGHLENRLPRSGSEPTTDRKSVTNDECYAEDPFQFARSGIFYLMFACYLRMIKFLFRCAQPTYIFILSVYVLLGFREPVPLIVLDIRENSRLIVES